MKDPRRLIEWLEELPEPYKSQAIENVQDKRKKLPCYSLADAVIIAFLWADSPQGDEYWDSFWKSLNK